MYISLMALGLLVVVAALCGKVFSIFGGSAETQTITGLLFMLLFGGALAGELIKKRKQKNLN
jgi:FtsH-binding integral membrane protein